MPSSAGIIDEALYMISAAMLLFLSGNISFSRDILPVFDRHCSGCHAANVTMGSLDLDNFTGVMRGGNNGQIVVPGKSADSRLYLMVARKISPGMPMDGKILPAAAVEIIRKWIDEGAKEKP